MKKILSLLLSFLLIFVFAGCAGFNVNGDVNSDVFSALNQLQSSIEEFESKYNEIESQYNDAVSKGDVQLYGPYSVVRIVDGDTIVVNMNGKNEKVRMIGVNTPESVSSDESKNCEQGKIASEYTKSHLTDKQIYLEYDTDKYDDYGRVLAYVYVNNEMYNEKLLKIGYAETMTIPPNDKYALHFAELEQTAKNNKIGFWDGYFS